MTTSGDRHVIFGTGPLGLAVMRALVAAGKRVRIANRAGRANVPSGVEIVAADVRDAAATRRACNGAAVVYQCAQPAYHRWPEEFPALQAAILDAAALAGARLVIGDNLYSYGEVTGPIREDMPHAATTHKGRTRARMVEAALAAHRAGKLQVAIGRGSDFFGPHVLESTLGQRALVPALHGKTAALVGKLDLPHTYTFIDDFGLALAVLGERPEAGGEVWHVPNPETLTQRQIMTVFFEAIGSPPRMRGMGRGMMRFGGLFIRGARETVEMMYEFEKPFVVDSSKFERTFGQRATPLRDAVRTTVAWYRLHFSGPRSARPVESPRPVESALP